MGLCESLLSCCMLLHRLSLFEARIGRNKYVGHKNDFMAGL
jgi:hypothetical protein